MGEYQFTAFDGDAHIPYEFVIDNGKPVKLGDGTFGCVFHVRGRNQNAALKIFYESTDGYILQSQDQEMSIGSDLRKHYVEDNAVSASINNYLVAPIASLDDFKKTSAYQILQEYFDNLSFKISDRAIVMEFYPMSLKDLLERGWPSSVINRAERGVSSPSNNDGVGRGAGGKFGDTQGYAVLRELNHDEREACILPFAEDVAEALSILHDPGFRHQDIKPANVLVRQVANSIEVAVADLGFIDSGRWQIHGSIWQSRSFGTRHYRSPEQTDFFDVCEVDIVPQKDGSYRLITSDPKFTDTFSEKGDLVVFSKFSEPLQWEIADITSVQSHEESHTGSPQSPEIVTEDEHHEGAREMEILLKPLPEVKLEADERTQISINKRQTARTDLFGLGAIIYDMITCGKSPERFYDLLRAHDRPSEIIERGIAQQYLHFRNGGGAIPEIDAVFQSLRIDSNSDYPSSEIVKVILKCMMSRPKDSYFNTPLESNVWAQVKSDLRDLLSSSPLHDDFRRMDVNWLTNPDRQRSSDRDAGRSSPATALTDIQRLCYNEQKNVAKRIVDGARYLNRVGEMVCDELRGGKDYDYLVDISPQSLRNIRGRFSSQYTLFESKKDLESMLSSSNPRLVLQALPAGTLLPPFMHSLTRECEVWVGDDLSGQYLYYDLWGTADRWDDVKRGDRLSIGLALAHTFSSDISYVGGGTIKIAEDEHDMLADLVPWRRYRGTIVRRFTPTDYYIAMLGVYVRLIFFVNPKNRRQYTPHCVLRSEQVDAFCLEEPDFADRYGERQSPGLASFFKGRTTIDPNKRLDDIFRYLAALYVRLLTRRGLDNYGMESFSPEIDSGSQIVFSVMDRFSEVIAQLLGISKDLLVKGKRSDVSAQVERNVGTVREFPDIDTLTNAVLQPATS